MQRFDDEQAESDLEDGALADDDEDFRPTSHVRRLTRSGEGKRGRQYKRGSSGQGKRQAKRQAKAQAQPQAQLVLYNAPDGTHARPIDLCDSDEE